MKTCPYCHSEIVDTAIRCRYCSSWLESTEDSKSSNNQTVVYVVDRGLLRFGKFVVSMLGVFVVVGITLYGVKLDKAVEQVVEMKKTVKSAQDSVESSKKSVEDAKVSVEDTKKSTEKAEKDVVSLKLEMVKKAEKVNELHKEILEQSEIARIKVATIETPLDESEARVLFGELFQEHFSKVFKGNQLAKLNEILNPRQEGGLAQIRDQPSFKLVRVKEALEKSEGETPITVAVLSDAATLGLPEFKGRLIDPKSFVDGKLTPGRRPEANKHGTAVMSVIAAIAPKAKFMPIAVLGSSGGSYSTIIEGLNYAVQKKARIVVIPLGGLKSAGFDNVFEKYHEDVLFVSAAGNSSSQKKSFPAGFPEVVAVGTTDLEDEIARFSNYGDWVDLVAPGVFTEVLNPDGKIDRMSGSSFSTSIVSGVAALILSINPELTAKDVRKILMTATVKIDNLNPNYSGLLGAGRIDALKAVITAKNFSKP